MITILNARLPVRVNQRLSTKPLATVLHAPAAVRAETLKHVAAQAEQLARRWGPDAASSLLAELEPQQPLEDLYLAVVTHGPISWVASGHRMMRPFHPTTWFAVGAAWHALPLAAGVTPQIKAAPDACLAHPKEVVAAVRAATLSQVFTTPDELLRFRPSTDAALQALAVPPRVEDRSIIALGWFAGCLGPLRIAVDTAEVSLDVRFQEPWKQQYEE